MARVLITEEATAQARRLPKAINARVLRIVDRLKTWPSVSGAKPLRHGLAGRYRIRTGDWRVQFRVEGNDVIIEKIGHRSGFYEE
jgi:mRNA-degrading endonuclease RelE of RelBE toxin-antitoxin system